MHPLLINTSDHGGAAKACVRLHHALLKQGLGSKFMVFEQNYKDIPESYLFENTLILPPLLKRIKKKSASVLREMKVITQTTAERKINHLKNELHERPAGLEMISFPYSDFDIKQSSLFREADIINLHWVSMFLDFESFFHDLSKPVVWTLHDMNPFSGGEHYDEKYFDFDEQGYPIERKISTGESKVFRQVINVKKRALKKVKNLHIVTPSEWLAEQARQSEVFSRFPVTAIPNGVDSSVFQPRNKKFARELLGIPQNKTVLLFVSDILGTRRKGFHLLQKAFSKLSGNPVLLSIGSKTELLQHTENYIELGAIKDELLMSVIYSAADAFVIPSLMDNLPNTIVESLLCATPVIGFPAGGIPEMIEDGKNGYLCPEISVNALTDTLNKFLQQPDCFDKEHIRKKAVEKYDQKVQAEAYIKLFEKLTK